MPCADGTIAPAPGWTRWPLACIGALLIVCLAELSLHLTRWPTPIPYALGGDETHSVVAQLNRFPPADVSFVGSSRVREGIVIPLLHAKLRSALHHDITVANYATGGGRAIDFEAVTNRLLRTKPIPEVIVVGIGERDFAGTGWQFDYVPLYWNLHEWRENFERRGTSVLDDLPTVLRNVVGQYVHLIGRREQIRMRLDQIMLGIKNGQPTSPIRGELTPWHVSAPHKKLDRKDPELRAKMQRYVARDLNPSGYPNADQVAAFERMAKTCQDHDVRLVVYEVPVSSAIEREVPPELSTAYRDILNRVTKQYDARLVRLRDLGFKTSYKEFREPSHMNLDGATRFTNLLADKVLIGVVQRDEHRDRHSKAANARKRHGTTATGTIAAPTTNPAAKRAKHPATQPQPPAGAATTNGPATTAPAPKKPKHPTTRPATGPATTSANG